MKTNGLARLAALGLAAAGFGGCGDQDSPGTPTGSTADAARQQALVAIAMVDQIAASSHELAAGTLTGFALDTIPLPIRRSIPAPPPRGIRSVDSPVWNPGNGAWEYSATYSDAEGSVALAYSIRFLDVNGIPQSEPDSTTDRIDYGVTLDVSGTGQDDRSSEPVDLDFSYEQGLQITDLQGATWGVVGGGSMSGSVDGRADGRDWAYQTSMDWDADLTVPADGSTCASGEVTVGVDDWTLVASYDAVSQVFTWTMTPVGGSTPVATGSATSACAGSAS